MSAASTATRVAHEDDGLLGDARPRHDLEMLQDILYDMLASGIDADQTSVTTDEVERFLHEHAREAKTLGDFRAFFDRHGLDADSRTHESAVLELPPITTSRESPNSPLAALTPELPIELTLGDLEESSFETPIPPPALHRFRAPRAAWIWIAIGCAVITLLVLAWRGYVTVTALRSELTRASEHHQQDRSAIQRLSDQTATLESNVAATGELVQRMDQKSDVLIDWVTKRKQQRRAAPLAPPAPSPSE